MSRFDSPVDVIVVSHIMSTNYSVTILASRHFPDLLHNVTTDVLTASPLSVRAVPRFPWRLVWWVLQSANAAGSGHFLSLLC